MSKYVSENAKRLIEIICKEHALQAERVAGGWIQPEQVQACIIERLNARANRDEDVKAFLQTTASVPENEDNDSDLPWAKDPRPPCMLTVDHRPQREGYQSMRDDNWIEERDFPVPGERVC